MRWFCPGVLLAALVASVNVLGQTVAGCCIVRCSEDQLGQPDLQGVWQVLNTAAWDIQDHAAQRFPGLQARFSVPAGAGVVEGNEIPYQPWALEQKQKNFANRLEGDPEAKCYLPGVPRITYMPYPFQIFQFADRVVILYEYLHTTREIFTDGSRHPDLPVEFWMGDSRGRWEGDTLVVDVTLFTGRDVVRSRRQLPQPGPARRRTLHSHGSRPSAVQSHDRRSESLCPAVEDADAGLSSSRTQ